MASAAVLCTSWGDKCPQAHLVAKLNASFSLCITMASWWWASAWASLCWIPPILLFFFLGCEGSQFMAAKVKSCKGKQNKVPKRDSLNLGAQKILWADAGWLKTCLELGAHRFYTPYLLHMWHFLNFWVAEDTRLELHISDSSLTCRLEVAHGMLPWSLLGQANKSQS